MKYTILEKKKGKFFIINLFLLKHQPNGSLFKDILNKFYFFIYRSELNFN